MRIIDTIILIIYSYNSYNLIMYMIKLFQTPGMYENVHLHCLGLS